LKITLPGGGGGIVVKPGGSGAGLSTMFVAGGLNLAFKASSLAVPALAEPL